MITLRVMSRGIVQYNALYYAINCIMLCTALCFFLFLYKYYNAKKSIALLKQCYASIKVNFY